MESVGSWLRRRHSEEYSQRQGCKLRDEFIPHVREDSATVGRRGNPDPPRGARTTTQAVGPRAFVSRHRRQPHSRACACKNIIEGANGLLPSLTPSAAAAKRDRIRASRVNPLNTLRYE